MQWSLHLFGGAEAKRIEMNGVISDPSILWCLVSLSTFFFYYGGIFIILCLVRYSCITSILCILHNVMSLSPQVYTKALKIKVDLNQRFYQEKTQPQTNKMKKRNEVRERMRNREDRSVSVKEKIFLLLFYLFFLSSFFMPAFPLLSVYRSIDRSTYRSLSLFTQYLF